MWIYFINGIGTGLILLHLEVNKYTAIPTARLYLFKATFKESIYVVNYIFYYLSMNATHDFYFSKIVEKYYNHIKQAITYKQVTCFSMQ